jgi:hypothetical protein
MAGFWKAPRALGRMLAIRELTLNEWALVTLLGQSGADLPDGFTTTNGYLAAAIHVDERTVRRVLASLRSRGFVAYDGHRGAAPFTVRTTAELASLADPTSDRRTDRRTDRGTGRATSDTPAVADARKPASLKGRQGVATSDSSRARGD